MILLRFLVVLLLIGLLPLSGLAADEPRLCFSESPFCISGRFATYWQEHGGLAVFGLPIADQTTSTLAGTPVLVQWFERARFEAQPQREAPFDVQLGRLGDESLLRLGRDWRAAPREAGPQPDCLWFAETGHAVCNQLGGIGFKSFWQVHGLLYPGLTPEQGSIALFGLPLTEAQPELYADGTTLLTQWFERARFEWHPDQPDQAKVMLGRLGSESPSAAPVAPASPTPAPSPTPIPPMLPTPAAATPTPIPAPDVAPRPALAVHVPPVSPPCNRNVPPPAEGMQLWVTDPLDADGTDQMTICVRVVSGGEAAVGASVLLERDYGGDHPTSGQSTSIEGVAAFIFYTGPGSRGVPSQVSVASSYRGNVYRAARGLP